MNTLKKIIFLTNNEKNKGMGILTLEKKNENIFGTLKIYNTSNQKNLVLGLKVIDKIIKQNVNLNNNIYNFILTEKINLDNNIGCVLLDVTNDIKPVLWGSEKSNAYKESIINSLKQSISKLNSNKIKQSENIVNLDKDITPTKTTQTKSINEDSSYTDPPKIKGYESNSSDNALHPIHNLTDNEVLSFSQISMSEEMLENSDIAVASQSTLFESSDDEIKEIIDNEISKDMIKEKESSHKFYNMIASQLDELFSKYPKEENLIRLIEDSNWVKINTDIDNKHYVVGIIYHNNDIKYICYGVPGNYSTEPPLEMKAYSQWLPTDITDPYSNGYWVMYQDADTGENIIVT